MKVLQIMLELGESQTGRKRAVASDCAKIDNFDCVRYP